MVSIGRGNRRRTPIPNNRGMADRANKIINRQAEAKAEKYTNSLPVDGTQVHIWHKTDGAIPCSCTSAPQSDPFDSIQDPTDPDRKENDTNSQGSIGQVNEISSSRYYSNSEFNMNDFNVGTKSNQEDSAPHKELDDSRFENYENDDSAMGDEYDDIDSAMLRAEQEDEGSLTDFDDPFNLFNAKQIRCPICLGAGYIDAWQLYHGFRVVFDTSPIFDFESFNATVDDSRNPTAVSLDAQGAYLTWRFKLPKIWYDIVRLKVYDASEEISADNYKLTWSDASNTKTMTKNSLNSLNNTGETIDIELRAEEPFDFTHFELVFSFAPPMWAQFPEINQVYENEFLDWNVSLSIELPPEYGFKEGDYIADSRYGKIWKISSMTRKRVSNGQIVGVSAEIRALHTFERRAEHLNIFEKSDAPGAFRTIE